MTQAALLVTLEGGGASNFLDVTLQFNFSSIRIFDSSSIHIQGPVASYYSEFDYNSSIRIHHSTNTLELTLGDQLNPLYLKVMVTRPYYTSQSNRSVRWLFRITSCRPTNAYNQSNTLDC
ncbi:hypothetical protein F5884DRAFT_759110 [Xylogone sp. PMI_703]|nr:hypothetical protein F5884DRAFT_759110 [Xylogone sp. PMI_703]